MSDETKHVFVGLVRVHSPTLWFLIFLNIIFAITSILGNVIILAALKKQSSLHPPSKILLSFLAITDLCAGLISLPIFITLLMAFQYKIEDIVTFTTELTSYISTALCLSSLFTLAAISVDRFLALFLGIRYRQVVTLRRTAIIVVCSWTVIAGCIITVNWIDILTVLLTYVTATVLLFLMVPICCYTMIYQKLLQHQAQVQGKSSSRWTKRTRATEHSSIQKDSVQYIMDTIFISGLLPALWCNSCIIDGAWPYHIKSYFRMGIF